MAVLLDANVCIFQERYMTAGFDGGQEIARLVLAWLASQFPEIRFFTIYLAGDFGRLFGKTDRSLVDIHLRTILEFADGFAQALQRQVEFTSRSDDKSTLFSGLMRKYSTDPNCGKVLLGAFSEDVRAALEKENQASHEKIALLETVESLEEAGFDEFQKVSNKRIFRDRLNAAGI